MTNCAGRDKSVWPYCLSTGSTGAAYLFAILYGSLTCLHIFQAARYKTRYCWVIIMGGIWETIAFAIRIAAINNSTSAGLYTPQFTLILVAPLWINAFDYMLMARLINYFLPGERVLGVKPRRMALLFVLLDISAFIVQLTGALMTTSSSDDPNAGPTDAQRIGLKVYTGGVGLQQAVILVFIAIAVIFHRRALRGTHPDRSTDWRLTLYLIYGSLALITLRIIYRMVEFASGVDSKIPKVEAYTYAVDALPMLIALSLFNIKHPGTVLIGPDARFPKKVKMSRAERKAAKAAKNVASNPSKSDSYDLVPLAENGGSRGGSPEPQTTYLGHKARTVNDPYDSYQPAHTHHDIEQSELPRYGMAVDLPRQH